MTYTEQLKSPQHLTSAMWSYDEKEGPYTEPIFFAHSDVCFPNKDSIRLGWFVRPVWGDRSAERDMIERATRAFLQEHPNADGVACLVFEDQPPILTKGFLRGPWWTLRARTVGTLKTMRGMLRKAPSKALLVPVQETLSLVVRSLRSSSLSEDYSLDTLTSKSTATSFHEALLCLHAPSAQSPQRVWSLDTLRALVEDPKVHVLTLLRHGRICAVLCTSLLGEGDTQTRIMFDVGVSPSGALELHSLIEEAARITAREGALKLSMVDGFETWFRAPSAERGLREVSSAQVWWMFRDQDEGPTYAAQTWRPSVVPLPLLSVWSHPE